MKQFIFVSALVLVASSLVFAQVAPGMGWNRVNQQTQETAVVKLDGKLSLINGMIGLKSGNKTYYLPGLTRLSGFIDGLKDGASVKVEGNEYSLSGAPEYSRVHVTKLTIGGKDYDLSQSFGFGQGDRSGRMGGKGGMGGRGGMGRAY